MGVVMGTIIVMGRGMGVGVGMKAMETDMVMSTSTGRVIYMVIVRGKEIGVMGSNSFSIKLD